MTLGAITWSPGLSDRKTVVAAAMPEAKRRQSGAAFEGVQEGFGLLDGRVVGAAIAPAAAVLVVGVAKVRGGGVERRDQGAGCRVGLALGLGGEGRGVFLELSHG